MGLSDQEYAHVSALLGSGVARAKPHEGPERREEERVPARGPAQLRFDAVGPRGRGGNGGNCAAAGGGGAAGGATAGTTTAATTTAATNTVATRCLTVYIHNISAGGLGLFAGTNLPVDEAIELRLTGRGGPEVSLRCTVRHCAALAPGLYGAGMNVVEYRTHEPAVELGPSEASAAWTAYLNRDTTDADPVPLPAPA